MEIKTDNKIIYNTGITGGSHFRTHQLNFIKFLGSTLHVCNTQNSNSVCSSDIISSMKIWGAPYIWMMQAQKTQNKPHRNIPQNKLDFQFYSSISKKDHHRYFWLLKLNL